MTAKDQPPKAITARYMAGELNEGEARNAHRAAKGLPPYNPAECCGGRCATAKAAQQGEPR